MKNFNLAFTIIFAVEMGLKLIGLGLFEYVRDKMNIFDGCIVVLSILEITAFNSDDGGGSAISAFRSVRIFRVLRVTRLIRSLQYMRVREELFIRNKGKLIKLISF